ncbi:MAG: methionine--tRNA ligase [Armatimonadota bacterium]|nr:methionine--tRNA ligase [Armatimonadota bacterium]MDR7562541.1 methionine--tRNA ligase [Armatimonadota bacterium]MDR7566875.1 methionine--tRNA ligase [Armatimonadota bacterium]MDR7602706.1 methionine--tRNA ligase [Armatimonadota bacterium]
MSDRFYITTAIDYVNASPHIGHAYEKILADVLARYRRLMGEEVYFLTGTDEHGQKIATAAAEAGREVQAFVDENAARFRDLCTALNLSNDDFIRTTDRVRHWPAVHELWRRVAARGDLYRKHYRALYCVQCEAFVTLSELEDGRCPRHLIEPQVIEEENYFFRLSRYRHQLRRLFEERPDFVFPPSRAAEMHNLIDTLEDISVSRPVEKLRWGIPVPDDPTHVIYVWFDALTNYLSAVGFARDEERFRTWWPAHHLIGKDINRFHSLLWPAMLLSAGVEPPRQVLVHGFLTVEGQKISKTLGNVIDPLAVARELAERSGGEVDVCVDALRYFLLREIPFGEDGDFSRTQLVHRFNADLANDYGNLLNRTLPLVERYCEGMVPEAGSEEGADAALRQTAQTLADTVLAHVRRYDFPRALGAIWQLLGAANRYLDQEAPWSLYRAGRRERVATVLRNTLEALRVVTVLLEPVMPSATLKVWSQLGYPEFEQRASEIRARGEPYRGTGLRTEDAREWRWLRPGTRVRPGPPVFPRIEARIQTPVASEEPKMAEVVSIEEFRKLDLRVAKVLEAERVPGTDKLIRARVDLGDEVRTIVAGLLPHYTPEDLVGRTIVVVANLEPRRVRGVESRGMLLAAEWEGKITLVTLDRELPPGARVT